MLATVSITCLNRCLVALVALLQNEDIAAHRTRGDLDGATLLELRDHWLAAASRLELSSNAGDGMFKMQVQGQVR